MTSTVILFEGPDRLGKSTQLLKTKKWFEAKGRTPHVLHYSNVKAPDPEKASRKLYTQEFELFSFAHAFGLDLLLDRSHLGEAVYSPIYRGYSGDYVFDLEKKHLKPDQDVRLVLFVDDPENVVAREDGKSFSADVERKTIEMEAFVEAFEKSSIQLKTVVDIDGKSIEDVWFELEGFLSNKKTSTEGS